MSTSNKALIWIGFKAIWKDKKTWLLGLLLLGGNIFSLGSLVFGNNLPSDHYVQIFGEIGGALYINFLLLFTVLLLSFSVVANELQEHTMQYLLSRAVRPWRMVMMKFIGFVLAMALLLPLPLFLHYLLTIGFGDGTFFDHLDWLVWLYLTNLLGVIGYGSVFILIQTVFKKALVVSMAYAVIWDFFVSFTSLADSMQSWVMSYQLRSLFLVSIGERVKNFNATSAVVFILVLSIALLALSGRLLKRKDID